MQRILQQNVYICFAIELLGSISQNRLRDFMLTFDVEAAINFSGFEYYRYSLALRPAPFSRTRMKREYAVEAESILMPRY